jgi:hypothetical protein
MVLPKRCCVIACARRPIVSSSSPPAGEISAAKSASEILDRPSVSRAAAVLVASDFLTSASSGSELNSETKLTEAPYQIFARSRETSMPSMMRRFDVVGFDALQFQSFHGGGLALDFLFQPLQQLALLDHDAVQLLDLVFEVGEVGFQFFVGIARQADLRNNSHVNDAAQNSK